MSIFSSLFRQLRQADLPQQFVLAIFAFLTLFPFFFMLMSSFKDNEQFFKQFWTVAFPLHPENYVRVFPRIAGFIGNSLLYSIPTLLLVSALAMLTGYGFARFHFRGREPLFLAMLSLMMLPAVLTLIPLFIQMRDWRWLNKPYGVILPWTSLQIVFATYVMRVFFEKLPKDIFEAARLDGASELRLFAQIAVPLAIPGLGTIAVLDLLFTWNDVLWPLVALLDRERFPIASGMLAFRGDFQTDYGQLFAGYTIASLPLIIFFIFMTRRFIRGLTGVV